MAWGFRCCNAMRKAPTINRQCVLNIITLIAYQYVIREESLFLRSKFRSNIVHVLFSLRSLDPLGQGSEPLLRPQSSDFLDPNSIKLLDKGCS